MDEKYLNSSRICLSVP